MHQGDAEIQPPLHAAGERRCPVMGPLREADHGKNLFDTLPKFRLVQPVKSAEEA